MENLLFKTIPDRVINSLFNEFDEHVNKYTTVYHYTSLESYSKIIENGEIWFSNIQSLNDPQEIKFGINTVINHLISDGEIRSKLKGITEKEEIFSNRSIIEDNVFVFSTSTAADTYQQWLNYGDSGHGICIGMDRGDLFDLMRTKMYGRKFIYTYPVQYFDGDKNVSFYRIKNFKKAITTCFSEIYELQNSKELDSELHRLLIVLASIIKDKFHKEEKEIRYLVFYPFANMALPRELLQRNQVDIVFKNQSFSMISKLVFHNRNALNLNENVHISDRSNDYRFISKLILGPKNSGNSYLFRNLFLFMKQFNTEFNMGQIKFSEGILK